MSAPSNRGLVRIALDGPSALTFYRDRCNKAPRTWQPPAPKNWVEIDEDGDSWLSDEDVAATLSEKSVFGRTTEFVSTGNDLPQLPTLKRSSMQRLAQCASSAHDLKLVPYDSLGIMPPARQSPLFILVPSPSKRHRVANVSQRAYTSPVSRYAFLRLENSVYVPSPEFLFALMAHYLALPGLMLLAMELCGHYRLLGALPHRPLESHQTLYDQQPLTSVSRLLGFVGKCGSFSGRKSALRALKYVTNGAASPMESIVYLLLCLPRSLGGYGIQRPLLNAKRPVTELAGTLTMANHLIPDLYWPKQRLDLEYDSDEFHSDPKCLVAGTRRSLALRAMHVEVVSLTYDIVRDTNAFNTTARLIARKLGQRTYAADDRTALVRKGLRNALLRLFGVYKPRLERLS